MSGYPTDKDVKEAMEDVLEDIKPIVYTLRPRTKWDNDQEINNE